MADKSAYLAIMRKIDNKNRISLPKEFLDELGLKKGDKVRFKVSKDGIIVCLSK